MTQNAYCATLLQVIARKALTSCILYTQYPQVIPFFSLQNLSVCFTINLETSKQPHKKHSARDNVPVFDV